MVIHDEGVKLATANPETATFPDKCKVSLNFPDAESLHKKEGTIVGVRDPVTKKYQVQLADEDFIKAWGSTIVNADEDEIRWIPQSNWPTESTEIQNSKDHEYAGNDKAGKPKSLPTRPYISKPTTQASAARSGHANSSHSNQASFVSPPTLATEGQHPPAPASPPQQRQQLACPSSTSSTRPTKQFNGLRSATLACFSILNFKRPTIFAAPPANLAVVAVRPLPSGTEAAVQRYPQSTQVLIPHPVPFSSNIQLSRYLKAKPPPHHPHQPPANGMCFCCAFPCSPALTSVPSSKRMSTTVAQREFTRARVTPAPASVSQKQRSKRSREEETVTLTLRSQRNLRNKK